MTVTTRAAVLRSTDHQRPYSDTRPLSVEELQLEDPGPGEVLVRLAAAGLCHSDLSVIDGSRPRPLPMVLGHEAAGVVEALGPGVIDLRPGDNVVFSFVPTCGSCVNCQSGQPALCTAGAASNQAGRLLSGHTRWKSGIHHHLGVSAFSEYTVASQQSLVKIDPEMPLTQAALFGCAVLTGVGAVINTARAEPGFPAAVFGLGGVGLSAVMGATLAGCYPIVAVDIREDKLALARRLGATHTVQAGDTAVEAVREATAGGARYCFEAVGHAAVMANAYAATRRGGKTVAIGLPHPNQELSVPAVSIVGEERQILGSYMGSAVPRRDIPRLLGLYKAGRLPVDLLFSGSIELERVNEGFEALAKGEVVRQLITFD
jgi:alcohol dehydrogenase